MRLSIRMQTVAVVAALVALSMGAYVIVATRIVASDREASVYDSNALVAGTVATQVEATVDGIADKLRYFGQEYETTPGEAERRAKSLFDADDEVLSLEVFKRGEGDWERSFLYVDDARLAALNLAAADLQEARKHTPVPLDAVAQSGVVLQNASLPPDLALVRLSAVTLDGKNVITADLRPERLLRVVGDSKLYRVFVVDAVGRVLAHPDGAKVINHEDLSGLAAVKAALRGAGSRGASQYLSDGTQVLAAWARVGEGRAAVVVEVPEDEVFRATRELSRRSVLFAVGTVGLALVLAVYFSRRVTAPLRRLQDTMATISRGEYGALAQVDGPVEVAAVGAALNKMSQELVQRADEVQRTNQQLVQSEKLSAIGELAASVAHEVKNPMVGILGFAQLGGESDDQAEQKEYFKLIEQDANRANKILKDLLEFARPPEAEMEAQEPNLLVQGSLSLVRHQLMMQGVKLETSYADGLPEIRANPNQMKQVLLNLCMNAGQAMAESPTRKVTVTTASDGNGAVVIRVSDTGPGMSEEVREKLFRPFFTTKRRGLGTGLGLSVSKRIVEAHRGTLTVESEVGKGATFVITIPAATAAEA